MLSRYSDRETLPRKNEPCDCPRSFSIWCWYVPNTSTSRNKNFSGLCWNMSDLSKDLSVTSQLDHLERKKIADLSCVLRRRSWLRRICVDSDHVCMVLSVSQGPGRSTAWSVVTFSPPFSEFSTQEAKHQVFQLALAGLEHFSVNGVCLVAPAREC